MTLAPSGQQFEIAFGSQRAAIVEVGGGIRAYSDGDRDVLEPFPREAMCDAAHGAVLIPWPNRIADGRYRFDGDEHRLALSEPARGNAIHGLLRWRPWQAAAQSERAVTIGTRVYPMTGYPFALAVSVSYELSESGLTVVTSAQNIGERSCPYGTGQHPYLSPGDPAAIDGCELRLPAATRLTLEEERQVPVGREPVDGTRFDFRQARAIGDGSLDDAFTDLARDGDDRAHARLVCADGASVELWVDGGYRFLQAFTGDTLPPPRRRTAVALEPMTCAPNAFQSGDGLIVLEPGETHTASWGVRLARG